MKIYVLPVYPDVKDKERNKYIHKDFDLVMRNLYIQMPVIEMGDFNGHVRFLGNQDKNHNGVKLLEFVERWNLIIMNCDAKCRGTIGCTSRATLEISAR